MTSSFNSLVLENQEGAEERIIKWLSPLLTFDLSKVILSKTQRDYIRDYFAQVKGNVDSFPYLDYSDYQATHEPLVNRLGSITQGILAGNIGNTQFQLIKTYQIGSNIHYRPITRPEPNSIEIYENGVLLTGWTEQEGKITLASPKLPNSTLTASFDFYVPVSFSQPQMQYRLNRDNKDKVQGYSLEKFQLEERRERPYYSPIDAIEPLPEFALDGYINSITSIQDSAEIIDLVSGYDYRTTRYKFQVGNYFLDQILMHRTELDYLIAFWRCSKGKGIVFPFEDRTYKDAETSVRFDDNNLEIELKTKDVFLNNNLKLREAYSAEIVTYGFFLGAVPNIYYPNSFVGISGQIVPSNASDPSTITLTFTFDFGVAVTIDVTPDSNGFFSLTLQTRPDLTYPETGFLTVTESVSNSTLYNLPIEVATPNPFTLSVPSDIFSGTTVNINGLGTAGQIVTLTIPELAIDEDIDPDASNEWSYYLVIPSTQPTTAITITATTTGYSPLTENRTIQLLTFDPVVIFDNFQYN